MSVEHLSQVVYNSELKMHQICDADATKKQSLIIGGWFYFVFLVSLALFTNSLDSFYPWNETASWIWCILMKLPIRVFIRRGLSQLAIKYFARPKGRGESRAQWKFQSLINISFPRGGGGGRGRGENIFEHTIFH
jgi:hypothetical protein